jgi:hypothetical protein
MIRVKVTNQTPSAPHNFEFNPLDNVDKANLLDVYGDSFISGFLSGGEFVGLVNIKVHDPSRISVIKARLEAAFGAAQARGSLDVGDFNLADEIETSIFVNWCGGGQIKDRTCHT